MLEPGRYDCSFTIGKKLTAQTECLVRSSGTTDKPVFEYSFTMTKPNFDLYKRAVELLRQQTLADFSIALDQGEKRIEFTGRVTNIGVNGIVVTLQGSPRAV